MTADEILVASARRYVAGSSPAGRNLALTFALLVVRLADRLEVLEGQAESRRQAAIEASEHE